jgi:hypothetical protein
MTAQCNAGSSLMLFENLSRATNRLGILTDSPPDSPRVPLTVTGSGAHTWVGTQRQKRKRLRAAFATDRTTP